VIDSAGNHADTVSQSMGVLVGDVNANGVTSNTDVSVTKTQVGTTLP
jgi:hypothetical protein